MLLKVLREVLTSTLPIQVWHLGPQEMDWKMSSLLRELGAEVVDAWRVGDPRERPETGWVLKPFALLHCPFREVLLLDADNVPAVNPEGLFEEPKYLETGAVFWPDLEPLPRDSAIWEICRVAHREEPSFESGQVLVDKQRCWNALLLTMHLNQHASFYYQHVNGDKDTFHMAWRMREQNYSMIPYAVTCLPPERAPGFEYQGPVLLQHDFAGRVVFQHRNFPKWILSSENPHYPGFQHEAECLGFLRELAERWDGNVVTTLLQPPRTRPDESLWFRYERFFCDEKMLEFLPDGRIGGGSREERRWALRDQAGEKMLEISSDGMPTCLLTQSSPGTWRGKWLHYEQMPVELTRWKKPAVPRLTVYGPFRGPTGHDHHVREFARELDRREVDVRLLDLPAWSPAKLPEHLRESWFEDRRGDPTEAPVLQFCMPHQVVHWPNSSTINYTMFEATRAPAAWIERSKTHDLVILPTESSRQAWIAGGMPADRIRLCPLGIDPVLYGVAIPPRELPGAHHRIRFLNVSAYGPRKNLAGLLRAWKRATSRRDDAVLALKIGCYEAGSREALERDLSGMETAAPVEIFQDLLPDADMPGLYAAATHYISVSHGEGWDQSMMEAAGAGLKLIAPAHSAYQAYLDDSVATLLPCREVPVVWNGDGATGELFRGANWWEPDEDSAVAAIRAAIDGRDVGKASARERILTEFTWQRATESLLEILSDLEARKTQRWFSWLPRRSRGAPTS